MSIVYGSPQEEGKEILPEDDVWYDAEIDPESDSTYGKVVRLVGHNKRVLEFGCATGYMSRVFRDNRCQVVAVEIDPKMAERASAVCERVIVGDIERIDLAHEIGEDRFDVVVMADFLEHLKDPFSVLTKAKSFLRANGYVVASVPNIAHGSVRLALLGGRFPYSKTGLLDRTHLRFFTGDSLVQLFERAGLAVGRVERQEVMFQASEVPHDPGVVSEEILTALERDENALTYQFVVVGYPLPRPELEAIQTRIRKLAEENESLRSGLARLQSSMDEQAEGLSVVSARNDQLAQRVASLLIEQQEAYSQLLRRDEEIQSLKPVAESNERLQKENQRLQEESQRLQKESQRLQKENQRLQKENQRYNQDNERLQQCNFQLSGHIRSLQEETANRDRLIEGIYAGRLWRLAAPVFSLHHLVQRTSLTGEGVARRIFAPRRSDGGISSDANEADLSTECVESRPQPNDALQPVEPWPNCYDVLCFSIIEWDFRFQRPQQIAQQFAERGHRVFYLSLANVCPPEHPAKFVLRPLRDNVYEVHLANHCGANVYGTQLADDRVEALLESVDSLCRAHRITNPVMLVQLPFWTPLVLELRRKYGWKIVYDCMDEWNGFPGWDEAVVEIERALVDKCDLLLVTAQKLVDKWAPRKRDHCLLVRNATNYAHFQKAMPNSLLEDIERPIIGYFGGITDWFDFDLVEFIARERPNYSFVLLGGLFDVDVSRFEDLPNVHFLGQQPYDLMPSYLYHFDVCTIPFKVNHITEATDPVKFYEYVSLGKPVVAPRMPELYQYSEFLYIAEDYEDFLNKLDIALAESDSNLVSRRIELARQNTWEARVGAIEEGIKRAYGRASIVIVTYNNVDYTRQCVDSVLRNSLWPDYEIIIVDNASTDGTRAYLRHLERTAENIKVILNPENVGFAKANNQGVVAASGDYLVLLNNDTIVPSGWLPRLLRHLERDPSIGLIGPVTNFSGNETKIDVTYVGADGINEFAVEYVTEHEGELFDIRMLPMHCVALRRAVFEQVGELDERFGVGMFEDDDYSHRVRLAGYRVVCAEDAFIHHFGQASFKKLPPEKYQEVFDRNKQYYEEKWGIEWIAHRHRASIKQLQQ